MMDNIGNGHFYGALLVSERSLSGVAVPFAPKPKPAPRTGLAPACLVVHGGRT
jgi:hypothetical protein